MCNLPYVLYHLYSTVLIPLYSPLFCPPYMSIVSSSLCVFHYVSSTVFTLLCVPNRVSLPSVLPRVLHYKLCSLLCVVHNMFPVCVVHRIQSILCSIPCVFHHLYTPPFVLCHLYLTVCSLQLSFFIRLRFWAICYKHKLIICFKLWGWLEIGMRIQNPSFLSKLFGCSR